MSQVFYVKDMSMKPKREKNDDHSIVDEPKRHIVLSEKRNIVGIEDKSDMLGNHYERDDRIPPFIVNKDPSILLNNEDTPWLRQDHNQGSYVKKKFTVVPA